MRFFATSRPPGAFGVRQLAAAFENGPMCPYFKDSIESGSKLPHSESFAFKNYAALSRTPTLPILSEKLNKPKAVLAEM
jgi:hypothetical protein